MRSWLGRWSQRINGIARRIRKIKEGRTTSKIVLSMELMCCIRLYLRCVCICGLMNLLHSCIKLIVNRIISNGVVSSIPSLLIFCCCIYSLCNILKRCCLACTSSVISNVAYFAVLRKNTQRIKDFLTVADALNLIRLWDKCSSIACKVMNDLRTMAGRTDILENTKKSCN